jgi:uncharacterized membrane protein YozB (DUF420 family)
MRFHSKFWGHLFIKEGSLICFFFFFFFSHVEISQITMPLVMLLVLLESLDESLVL